MIKAIFFDVDGTLVSFDTHTVPESTVQALTALREKGILIFVATGRHQQAINNLGTLEFDGYITLNGGYCTLGKEQVVYKHAIPASDIDALIRYQDQSPYPCIILQEHDMYINYLNTEVETLMKLINLPPLPFKPLSDAAGTEIFQLVSFFSGDQEKEVMTSVMPNCEATRWYPHFADVIPAGVSKSVGIDKILARLNIRQDECMAFGDGGNDIPMLRHAGIGVAMGNANAEVQAAADYVTTTVDDNGISCALKHFLLI